MDKLNENIVPGDITICADDNEANLRVHKLVFEESIIYSNGKDFVKLQGFRDFPAAHKIVLPNSNQISMVGLSPAYPSGPSLSSTLVGWRVVPYLEKPSMIPGTELIVDRPMEFMGEWYYTISSGMRDLEDHELFKEFHLSVVGVHPKADYTLFNDAMAEAGYSWNDIQSLRVICKTGEVIVTEGMQFELPDVQMVDIIPKAL